MRAIDRRHLLAASAAAVSSLAFAGEEKKADLKGNVNHSIVFWCFNLFGEKWGIDRACGVAKSLGCKSVELVSTDDWATLKKHGLTCAIAPNGMPGAPYMKGLNNKKYHDQVIAATKKAIDSCAEAKVPSVIAFTGYKYTDADDPKSAVLSRDDGERNCVAALKALAKYAEKKKVTVCLEHLNTRDDSHPMKGHPGYQGDDLDWVAGILRRVASDRVKLLFDVYHVQIMHGDIIRRLEQCKDVLGHVHTAGCPGRGELNDSQEINYAPVMKKLVQLKYAGYVGHEFMPTGKPLDGLRQAVRVCDV